MASSNALFHLPRELFEMVLEYVFGQARMEIELLRARGPEGCLLPQGRKFKVKTEGEYNMLLTCKSLYRNSVHEYYRQMMVYIVDNSRQARSPSISGLHKTFIRRVRSVVFQRVNVVQIPYNMKFFPNCHFAVIGNPVMRWLWKYPSIRADSADRSTLGRTIRQHYRFGQQNEIGRQCQREDRYIRLEFVCVASNRCSQSPNSGPARYHERDIRVLYDMTSDRLWIISEKWEPPSIELTDPTASCTCEKITWSEPDPYL